MKSIRLHIYTSIIICLWAVAAVSCRKEQPINTGGESDNRVEWGVTSVAEFVTTKGLIDSLPLLQRACTDIHVDYAPGQPGLGKHIGIWADYEINLNGYNQVVSDVFNGLQLYYDPTKTSIAGEKHTGWTYDGLAAYWVPGGKYYFRAYYPLAEVNVHESSSAKVFVIESNTITTQEDLLVAYNSYDTKTGTYYDGTKGSMSDPVLFKFHHAMSALKFRFKFVDKPADKIFYSDDHLTACWLENVATEAFAATGLMAYGGQVGDERNVEWHPSYYPAPGLPMYKWYHAAGVPFSNTKPTTGAFDPTKDQVVAEAYSAFDKTIAPVSGDVGELFTENDGWLIIIPQVSTGNLQLCFTTKKSGDSVFRVRIPAVTGTSYAKYDLAHDAYSTHVDANGKDFIPGWRYTYTISISKTDATLTLGISPWNKLDSSFDVTL